MNKTNSKSKEDITNSEYPLIFIHGIKGGLLADKSSNKLSWITPWQGIGLNTPELKLPLTWKQGEIHKQDDDSLIPIGIVNRVTLIPNIIDIKFYDGIIKEGTKKYQHFYPFAYDWRRSNLENVDKYLDFIKEIVKKNHKPVRVVAHSMGGLITMVAMQKEPDLFDTVFFVGVPFAGGIGFLRDLHQGVPNGINNKILSPEVLATMPSVYSLFPLKSEGNLSDGKKDINVDFFNPKDWEDLKMGPFAYSFSNTQRFKEHFKNALSVAKIFRSQIFDGKLISNGKMIYKSQPKVFVILGDSLPTLTQVIKNGPKSTLGFDFDSAKKITGDGRVAEKDSYPPSGLNYTELKSPASHENQLNDPKVLEWIFSKI